MLNYNKSFVDKNDCLNSLKDNGVAILSNTIDANDIDLINTKIKYILEFPSIGGQIGYYMKDPFKKTYDAFLIDKIIPNILANKSILSIIKEYLNDDILITEAFLKNDIGDNTVYFPYHRHTGINGNTKLFGCGVILYLDNITEEGSFCYSLGSHKMNLENEHEVLDKSSKKEICLKNLRRINGKKGDIIIFDESGYHGPEQPTKISRTAIFSGYRSKSKCYNQTKTEIPLLNTSLHMLDQNQKDALGFNCKASMNYEEYHLRKRSNIYSVNILKKIFQAQFNIFKFFKKFKTKLK